METTGKQYKDMTIKALAVVGFLSLLALGSFISISTLKATGGAMSSLASAIVSLTSLFSPREELTLSASTLTVPSGNETTISISNRDSEAVGEYSLLFSCLDGFQLEMTTKAAGVQSLTCDVPHTFTPDDGNVTLRPFSLKNRFVEMPISISFNHTDESNTSALTKSIAITITNSDVGDLTVDNTPPSEVVEIVEPAPITTPAPVPVREPSRVTPGTPTQNVYTIPVGTTPTETPNGKADLKVSILEVGVVDKVTGAFAKSDILRRSDRIGVRFVVENIGTKQSGEWRFNAILPTYPPHTFNSDSQISLRPGDKIEFTIGFDQAIEGSTEVRFVIDPQQSVQEIAEDNNATSVSIKVL